jgi:hypothetical protein
MTFGTYRASMVGFVFDSNSWVCLRKAQASEELLLCLVDHELFTIRILAFLITC